MRSTTVEAPSPDPNVRRPSRLEVRSVECQECGAEAEEPCVGRRGPRTANHQTRVNTFEVRRSLLP